MNRLTLALLLWFLFVVSASADGPIYLPIIEGVHPCQVVDTVSDWKVILPEANGQTYSNYAKNPSAEIAGNFAALAGTTVARETNPQHYGLYAYRVQTNADNEGISLTLETLPNVDFYVTVRVSNIGALNWDLSLDNTNYTAPTLLENIDGEWLLYGVSFPSAQANGSTTLYIRQNGAGTGDFFLDGIQVEPKNGYYTTYCDGSQEGCEWAGTPHASASIRSPESRAGGRVFDLEDDYGLKIAGFSGTGTAPLELFSDSYSQLPGGELNAIKTNSRVFTLTGLISEPTEAEFYQVKQTLESLFDAEAYPEDENGPQPIRLRFTGAAVHKEIAVHYEGGLEANITADDPCAWERVAVRFLADDPYWYEIGESAALLDTEDSATFRTVAARLRSTGQWSPLGPPNAAGTYTAVYAFAEDDTYIYIGGDFLNFDNIAAADYIVRYNKATGAYSAMAALNGIVRAIALAPNGDVVVAGEFTNASGVAAADYIAVWAVGASAFTALGTPVAGVAAIIRVHDLLFDPTGTLWIVGEFDNWANIANADNIVTWTGSAYAAPAAGANGLIEALTYYGGKVYIAGNISSIGGVAVDTVAAWDISAGAYEAVGDGSINGAPHDIEILNGLPVVGTSSTPYAWILNGQTWVALGGSGTNGVVHSLEVGPDSATYLSGAFSQAGDVTLADRIAKFNGYSFGHLDIDLPGSPIAYAIMASQKADSVVPQKYDLWVGFNTTGTGTFAGLETVTNGGTAPAFPKIIFSRSGGTSAIIETLKNERTGLELLFNYSLLDGETLTVDLTPAKKSISSNFFGGRQDAVLANSDFGDWSLLTGSNSVTSFVANTGATVTGYLLWKDSFKSQN